MGRESLGQAAKTTVAAGRITEDERAVLIGKYGKLSTFVRVMVDREMAEADK